jgi:hypothetical protein
VFILYIGGMVLSSDTPTPAALYKPPNLYIGPAVFSGYPNHHILPNHILTAITNTVSMINTPSTITSICSSYSGLKGLSKYPAIF